MATTQVHQVNNGVYLDHLSIHRIREALQIITQFTSEPDGNYGGMKIRHEVRFINSLLTEAVRGAR